MEYDAILHYLKAVNFNNSTDTNQKQDQGRREYFSYLTGKSN